MARKPVAGGDADVLDDPPTIPAQKHHKISVTRLQIGMFVAELDRPWLDTPFLLQGFLVDSKAELDTLRKYCRFVYVDLELSSPDVVEAIREAEQLTAREAGTRAGDKPHVGGPPAREEKSRIKALATPRSRSRSHKPIARPPLKVHSSTRDRFRELVRASGGPDAVEPGLFGRWFTRLAQLLGLRKAPTRASMKAARTALQNEVLAALPPSASLASYEEQREIAAELPRAKSTFDRSENILERVVHDVKKGALPELATVQAAVGDMVDSMVDNADALMWVARLREADMNAYNHGVKVALYMIALGRHLGLPKDNLSHLGQIGMLADVGKIKLPRALLDKPGMLSPSEHSIVKEHVRLGLEALKAGSAPLPPEVEEGIAQHHERLDGTGYPKGLKGDEIGLWGRIAGIADCFAALITSRAYANALPPQEALMNMYQWAGTSFHEPLVEQFVQAVGVFPVGSLVELSTGEIAVVIAQNKVRRIEPKVLVLTWPDKRPLGEPVERDLFNQPKSGPRARIARGLAAGAYGLKLRDYYADRIAEANELV